MPDPSRDEKRQQETVDAPPVKTRYEPPEAIHVTELSRARGGGDCASGVLIFRIINRQDK